MLFRSSVAKVSRSFIILHWWRLTPYMFSQDDDVPCTLLLRVNGELKDVAKASIVTPLNRILHTVTMPDGVFRVALARVLPGCANLDPPAQPPRPKAS